MDPATQERLAARIRNLLRTKSTDLAPTSYQVSAREFTSDSHLADELEGVFLNRPLLAGLSGEARTPGEWFSFDASGRSAIVWRATDGTLRAFVNACRHRGMRVASGCGRATRLLTCPYHSWSYDSEGRLSALPNEEGFSDVARHELGLAPLPVHEDAGLVYVSLTPAACDAAGVLGGVESELGPFDLASYHRIERREHRFETNWKLTIDSFMEAYHLHFLHEDTLRPIFHGNLSAFDAFGPNCRIVGVRRSFDGLAAGESLLPHVTLLYHLFPNAVLIHQQDHIELYQSFPDPRDPNASHVRVTLYTPRAPETDAERVHWRKNLELIDRVTTTEDFAACEKIQANLRAGMVPFVIVGRNEPAVAHFHRTLRAVLDRVRALP